MPVKVHDNKIKVMNEPIDEVFRQNLAIESTENGLEKEMNFGIENPDTNFLVDAKAGVEIVDQNGLVDEILVNEVLVLIV